MKKDDDKSDVFAGRFMTSLTERELRAAIQAEVDRGPDARVDTLKRLVGRFNRLRGGRCQRGVLGLLSRQGSKDVNSILDADGSAGTSGRRQKKCQSDAG